MFWSMFYFYTAYADRENCYGMREGWGTCTKLALLFVDWLSVKRFQEEKREKGEESTNAIVLFREKERCKKVKSANSRL